MGPPEYDFANAGLVVSRRGFRSDPLAFRRARRSAQPSLALANPFQVPRQSPINQWANIGRSTTWTVVLSMNQRETTSAPSGAGSALLCTALLLLPLTGFSRGCPLLAAALVATSVQAHPYLATIGAPALRFGEPPAPPEILQRPVVTAPVPGPASSDVTLLDPTPSSTLAENTNNQPDPSPATSSKPANEAAPLRTPPPIIPDDLHPRVRAEDFLPFFQIPVSRPGDVNVVVPGARAAAAPATVPISSATYTQTPR